MAPASVGPHLRRGLAGLIACGLVVCGAPSLGGAATPPLARYQVDLGPPAHTGAEAVKSLPDRVAAVTDWNACGRELEFRRDTRKSDIGEGMLSAVMGKILWMQTHAQSETCSKQVRIYLEEFTGYFLEDETGWQKDGAPELNYINEQFRLAFDPTSLPYPLDDPDRQCGPIVTGSKRIADDAGGPGQAAFDVDFAVDWFCMRRQINMALMRPVKITNLGTTDLPCGIFKEPGDDLDSTLLAETGEGEWDINVRDLLRVVYLDRDSASPLLDTATRDRILNDLVTVSGPLEEDSYSIYECGNQERDTGSPQDRADERAWYEEGLFDDLGDLLDWLWNRILIFAGVAAALLAGYFVLGFQWLIPVAIIVGAAGVAIGFLRIPESENHLFMINTSRYLMNRLIIEALPDADDRERYDDDQEDIKDWLLDRLQRVTSDDFREYNARPYQRYTIMAIMNLHDFANDGALERASQIVLDFAAAKFAAGSNQGRRMPPFRRLLENIPGDFVGQPPRQLFDMFGGADHQIAAMLLFAGQTGQLPDHKATINSAAEMMVAASSKYRPDQLILNVAADKRAPYDQRIHHDGYEIYSSARGFLLSAGGVQSGLANQAVLGPIPFDPPKGWGFDKDLGAAMPTVLIPNAAVRATSVLDFLRIEGTREYYAKVEQKVAGVVPWSFDHNICVRKGFACGVNLVVPPALDNAQCLTTAPNAPDQWRFIDSATCPPYRGAPHFFVVLYRQPCIAADNECLFIANWGFLEAVDNPSLSFDQFKTQVVERNPPLLTVGLQIPSSLIGTYVSAQNERVTFDVKGHERDSDTYGIISVDNKKEGDADDWDLASGDVITADGDGRMQIHDPSSPKWIEIDFSDEDNPKRTVH